MKDSGLKIALINATKNDYGFLVPPLGILSIASYLLNKGIIKKKNIMILDVNLRKPMDFLKFFKPDLVGLSAMTVDYPDAITLGKKIKKFLGIPIIIGGIHISACPKQLRPSFDVGVVGEGEETFFELVKVFSKKRKFNHHELKKIKGLVFMGKEGKLEITPARPLIAPLDKLPCLDWSLLPRVYFRNAPWKVGRQWRVLKEAPLFTSRGCPFNCVFCARNSVFKGVRFFSVKRAVDEIENLVRNYGIEVIHIWDDTFVLSKKRIKDLIKKLKKRNLLGKVLFTEIFTRADLIDEEFLVLLKEMGVINLYYGFESGSEKILAYLKGNTVTMADNRKAVILTDKYGIGIIGSFMFGSPNETKKDMEKTLDFIRWAIKKNFVRLDICRTTPYPGTKIWRYAFKKGIVSENVDWSLFLMGGGPTKEARPLFFNEKVSFEDYRKIWNEARRLIVAVKKRNEKQGAAKAAAITRRREKIAHAILPFDLIWREFKNGRFLVGAGRLVEKLMDRLIRIN